jgi:hypothetical protein
MAVLSFVAVCGSNHKMDGDHRLRAPPACTLPGVRAYSTKCHCQIAERIPLRSSTKFGVNSSINCWRIGASWREVSSAKIFAIASITSPASAATLSNPRGLP